MRQLTLGLALLVVLVLAACTPTDPVSAPASETATGEVAPPATPAGDEPSFPGTLDDAEALAETARRLAGLDDAGGATPWTEHAAALEPLWNTIEEQHLAPMAAWAEGALADVDDASLPVFYPFGGPDLPSVQQFFPEAGSYVLIGLEPPGTLPRLDGADAETLARELERLRSGFENLAEKGYFVAKHMEADFAARHLEGFLPVLYIALARSGYLPTAVRFFTLEDDGTPRTLDTVTPSTARAVEITFRRDDPGMAGDPAGDIGGSEPRTLYYLAQDLSNEGFAATPGFARFIANLGPQNVYMKAAMYLPHTPDFRDFETLVLDHAQTLLQEDSGIPLAAIDGERFDITLFGAYEATLPNYREYFQEDLRDAYVAAQPAPLPFAIGYNRIISGTCLIRADRKGR